MIAGYVRTSRKDQQLDRQLSPLRQLCDRVCIEQVSAGKRRPKLEAVLKNLKRGDTFAILDVDRAFRSTIEALKEAEALWQRGVRFRILNTNVDTATPEGELQYTLMAAYARYERRILIRRTREGLDAARAKGRYPGRPAILPGQVIDDARERYACAGTTLETLAAELGVHRTTLSRSFKRQDNPNHREEATV